MTHNLFIFWQIRYVLLIGLSKDNSPCFGSHTQLGSLSGLVTLNAYMAAKIGIEEYLMEKFHKIYYQLED